MSTWIVCIYTEEFEAVSTVREFGLLLLMLELYVIVIPLFNLCSPTLIVCLLLLMLYYPEHNYEL